MKRKLSRLLLAVATVAFASALAAPALAFADEAAGSSFADVEGTEWFAEDVEWANETGLMTGTGDGINFEPTLGTTRSMFVTSLYRLEGEPAPEGADARVPEGKWYTDAALWALEVGVLKGYDDGDLGLDDVLTREQAAVFTFRYAEYKGFDLSEGEDTNILSYLDADKLGSWAIPAMQWACGEGLLRGYTDADGNLTGYLGPKDQANRAMTAAILHRLVENVVIPGTEEEEEPEAPSAPSAPSYPSHQHRYGDWEPNGNGAHYKSCECGADDGVVTEDCTFKGYVCTVCGYEGDTFYAKVSTDEGLKKALSEDAKRIIVDLAGNVAYDVAAWNGNPMGGENTESIVINGNEYSLTFNNTNSDWNNVVTGNAVLTINNAIVTNGGHDATSGTWNAHDIVFKNEIVLNDVVLENAIALMDDATLNNVALTDDSSKDAYGIWIRPNGQTIVIDGLKMDMTTSEGNDRGIKIDNQYSENDDQGVTLTVKNAEFKTEEKAAILVKSTNSVNITLENVDISGVAADFINEVWVDEDAKQHADKVIVTGGSVVVEGSFKLINAADELVEAFVNLEAGDVLYIAEDIDMTGKAITPVTGNKPFTMLGNGINIISNLDSTEPALFVAHSGSAAYVFDGIVLEDCDVDSSTNYGALFVGNGDTSDEIRITNCHVVNCTVESKKYAAAFVGYTAGYNVQSNGPVYSDVTIKGCSVTDGSIAGGGSTAVGIAHAGGNDDTTSIIENLKVDGVDIRGGDADHTGIAVGTAGVGDTVVNNVNHNNVTGNCNTAHPLYGRFVPNSTGSLTIDGVDVLQP